MKEIHQRAVQTYVCTLLQSLFMCLFIPSAFARIPAQQVSACSQNYEHVRDTLLTSTLLAGKCDMSHLFVSVCCCFCILLSALSQVKLYSVRAWAVCVCSCKHMSKPFLAILYHSTYPNADTNFTTQYYAPSMMEYQPLNNWRPRKRPL